MKIDKKSTIIYLQSKTKYFIHNKLKCIHLQYIDNTIVFDAYKKWDNKAEFIKYYMMHLKQIPDIVMLNLMKCMHESFFYNFDVIKYIETQCTSALCSIDFDIELYFILTKSIKDKTPVYYNNKYITAYNKLKKIVVDHYLHNI